MPDVPTYASIIDDIDGPGAGARDFPGTHLMPLDFDGIAARGQDDVWIAVGERELVRWDGRGWRHHPYRSGGGEELMFGPDGKLWATGTLGGGGVFSKTQHPLVFDGKALVVDVQPDDKFALSVRNIAGVRMLPANRVTARDVADTRKIVLTQAALEKLQDVLS